MKKGIRWPLTNWIALLFVTLLAVGCSPEADRASEHEGQAHDEGEVLSLPALEGVDLGGTPLKVIATTSIIGDVVAQVGGEAIDLVTLIEPGQDPHSFEPTPQQMATVSQAHVVFVNGWDLEEALVHDLEQIAKEMPIVPVSAGIEPLAFGEHEADEEQSGDHEEHPHSGADPHTWFDIRNVEQWVENIKHVLSDLDPAQAEIYEQNAATYRTELEELKTYVEQQLATIPAEKRTLVTNHDSLGYLAYAYDLHVLGTVLPAASTLAEPSASDLATLIETMEKRGLCTLFTETTVSDKLAQTVAAELAGCDQVTVLKLYTGAIGPAGSGADSYIGMFRSNVDTIVQGLK